MNKSIQVNPLEPASTWSRKPGARAVRLEQLMADAVDSLEAAESKLRRAFRAWDRAKLNLARVEKRFNKALSESQS